MFVTEGLFFVKNRSNVDSFKLYHLSSFVIPFFRIKSSSYTKELAFISSSTFKYINCLIALTLAKNYVRWINFWAPFCRSIWSDFFLGNIWKCCLLWKTSVISFMLFTYLVWGPVLRFSFIHSFLV